MIPTYVYGVVAADTALPEGLRGLGPSGTVSLMTDGQIAAVAGDVPVDRPLATRDDLMTNESVWTLSQREDDLADAVPRGHR